MHEITDETWLYWKSWLWWWHGDRVLIDTEMRNRCFYHISVLYLMSNHAQTILHEIPLQDEPTDTPKQMFTVQKITLFKNNSTFFIIKMKHFSIDHNSSSVNSWQIVLFQNVSCRYHVRQRFEKVEIREIENTRWVPTKWVSTLTSTHKSWQLLTKTVRIFEWRWKLNFTRLCWPQKAGPEISENLDQSENSNRHCSKGKKYFPKSSCTTLPIC